MPSPFTSTVELKTAPPPQVASSGPYTKNEIVPVALALPESVAVSEMLPPIVVADEAWVVKVGALLTTVAVTVELSFSGLLSASDVTVARFV